LIVPEHYKQRTLFGGIAIASARRQIRAYDVSRSRALRAIIPA
jgi:hypothetical protein